MNSFFESTENELELDSRINAVLSQCNSPINAFRASAEKANFVANFLPQMDRFHFKINAEIIEVATRNYSFLFFPELTHMDYPHYISECEDFYMTVLSILSRKKKVSILDIGCGVCDIAAFLSDNDVFYSYRAVDKNHHIVLVNKCYYDIPGLVHECSDILEYSFNCEVDYAFLFNIVKHLKRDDLIKIIMKIFASSPNAMILVYDIEALITALLNDCMREGYECNFEKQMLCISKRINIAE